MRFLRFAAALSVAASGITTAVTLTTATPATGQTASNGVCPALTASAWQLPYAPHTKGSQYDVHVKGYSCAQADSYIKKLVTHKVSHGIPTTVKGGPAGWHCTASPSKAGLAYTGQCSKSTKVNGTFFAWSVG